MELVNDYFSDVLEFHRKLAPDQIGGKPNWPRFDVMRLRVRLIDEEIEELKRALAAGTLADAADGIADSIYVLIGLSIAMGIDLRPVWAAVQKANMAKEGGPTREDGKVLKPEGWQPPPIQQILDLQEPLAQPELNG